MVWFHTKLFLPEISAICFIFFLLDGLSCKISIIKIPLWLFLNIFFPNFSGKDCESLVTLCHMAF